MKTIERYVFGSFLTAFLLAFLVLSFVLTIGLLVQIVGYMLQGLPMNLVGQFALVSFPETMQWTIPLGLLVASVLVFSRMSADSEVAAMRACGVNLLTVMRWPILFSLVCSAVGLFINNEIVPRGHEIRRQLKTKISVGTGLELLEPGRVINDFPKVKVYFESKEGNVLHDLIVLDYSNAKVNRMVTAGKAIVKEEGRDLVLDLFNMTVDPLDEEHPGMARAERFQYRVKDAFKDSKYKRREKDYRFAEMSKAIDVAKARVNVMMQDKHTEEGRMKSAERKFARRYLSDIRTEFQKRWVFALASLCFVLVGVPLGIRAQRRESSVGMAISLVTALTYYLVVILMMSFSKRYYLHPEVLIWLPVVLCGALAAYLVPKNL